MRWSHLLLCLGLLLGQTAALAHATHHELFAGQDQTPCEQCAMAHSLAAPPAVTTLELQEPPEAGVLTVAFRAPPSRKASRPHSRGPPTIA